MIWLMMERLKMLLVLLGLICVIPSSSGISVSCMKVYDEAGASAVFESPDCPEWVLSPKSLQNQTINCQFATLQGHRAYQEDRISCNLKMKIPFLGKDGPKEVMVGVLAVFDGHGGKEASEMASKLLFDYFFLHTVFNAYERTLLYREEHTMAFQAHNNEQLEHYNLNLGSSRVMGPVNKDESTEMQILKEALLRTILDIDYTFFHEAIKSSFYSGSTATIVLMLDGQILVANVGDSKALLCSAKPQPYWGAEATELTRDHHPDRDDERARIEAAGGFVTQLGLDVPRVNGLLAMSRAIGDLFLKRYGVISVPEITGWRPLTTNNGFLVVASDGIFESLTVQDVCDLLWDSQFQGSKKLKLSSSCVSSSSLAECIVNTAFEEGSMDNLSAIVVSLRSAGFSWNLQEERCDDEEDS